MPHGKELTSLEPFSSLEFMEIHGAGGSRNGVSPLEKNSPMAFSSSPFRFSGGQICHWRMRGHDGLQKLKAEELKLSLFVCDMHRG
jgi:hypothetical protein